MRKSLGIAQSSSHIPEVSQELQREDAMRFERNAIYRRAVWQVLMWAFFPRWILAGTVVLDLGCGCGEFINQITAGRTYEMDLNPDARAKLQPDVSLLAQDCSSPWQLLDESLGAIFTSNFFEHLPDLEMIAAEIGEDIP